MLTGSYVSGSGAGLAFDDWPLFNGSFMPDGGRLAMIHATHRFAALAVGIVLAYLAYRAMRSGYKPVLHGSLFALVLYVAQALVGAANIWTLLQPSAVAAHVALAAALWATLVIVAYFSQRAAGAPLLRVSQHASEARPSTRSEPAAEPS
jgi:heme A synthase